MSGSQGIMRNPKPVCIIANGIEIQTFERTYLLCGVQRSGTSMVAAVLHALGVDMGRGGLNHEDAEFLARPREVEAIVADRNVKPIWGFKIPEFALSLDHFAKILRHPVFVLIFRNPVSILDSAMVRGDGDYCQGIERISSYFGAMLRFARESKEPVVLISYERAASNPIQFIDEVTRVLRLAPTEQQKQDALQCITGDGGGYTHLPGQWHRIGVQPPDGTLALLAITRTDRQFFDVSIVAVVALTDRSEAIFHIAYSSDAEQSERWVRLLVDFGSGFDMLNTYNVCCPCDNVIFFEHRGSVRQVAFGFAPGYAPILGVSMQATRPQSTD
jgi:hypothetical protein